MFSCGTRSVVRWIIASMMVIAIVVLVWRKRGAFKRCMDWCREQMGAASDDPTLEPLRQRFARGELTQQECEERRKRLLTA